MTLFAKPAKKKDDYKGKKMPGKKCMDTVMKWGSDENYILAKEVYKSHGHPTFTNIGSESNIPTTLNQGQGPIKVAPVTMPSPTRTTVLIIDKPISIEMPADWIWKRTEHAKGKMTLSFSPPTSVIPQGWDSTSAVEKTQSTPQASEARKSWIEDLEVVAARVKAYQEQVSLKEKDLLLDRKEDY